MRRGITLVDVLALIVIVAIPVVGILLPALASARKNAIFAVKSPVSYEVRIVRPDGQTHTSFAVRRRAKPNISIKEGCLIVEKDELMEPYIAPSGWLIEVREQEEAQ